MLVLFPRALLRRLSVRDFARDTAALGQALLGAPQALQALPLWGQLRRRGDAGAEGPSSQADGTAGEQVGQAPVLGAIAQLCSM